MTSRSEIEFALRLVNSLAVASARVNLPAVHDSAQAVCNFLRHCLSCEDCGMYYVDCESDDHGTA